MPNMEFREGDQEQFEDNPEEFIRRDLEGSGERSLFSCSQMRYRLDEIVVASCQVSTATWAVYMVSLAMVSTYRLRFINLEASWVTSTSLFSNHTFTVTSGWNDSERIINYN